VTTNQYRLQAGAHVRVNAIDASTHGVKAPSASS